MAGRVRRKMGLAAASAKPVVAAAALCGLCGRPLGAKAEQHHVIPRSRGGEQTVAIHPICHRAIHAAVDNAELARLGTLAALVEHPALRPFLRWIADKPPDFHAPTRRRRVTGG